MGPAVYHISRTIIDNFAAYMVSRKLSIYKTNALAVYCPPITSGSIKPIIYTSETLVIRRYLKRRYNVYFLPVKFTKILTFKYIPIAIQKKAFCSSSPRVVLIGRYIQGHYPSEMYYPVPLAGMNLVRHFVRIVNLFGYSYIYKSFFYPSMSSAPWVCTALYVLGISTPLIRLSIYVYWYSLKCVSSSKRITSYSADYLVTSVSAKIAKFNQ